jgi:hypothetical protein
MYYIINPLIWPFTIIPNLPENLIEVIDSPIPLLIGMIGDKALAEKVNKIRGGNNNIIIIENENLTYYKDEKLSFDDNPLFDLLHSLKKNFDELKLEKSKKRKNENYYLIIEKIYKNIYGCIKNDICQKVDYICDKYKNLLRESALGVSEDGLSRKELELRQKIKNQFISTYCDLNKNFDFYRIFSQTQIFASYLDKYIVNNK